MKINERYKVGFKILRSYYHKVKYQNKQANPLLRLSKLEKINAAVLDLEPVNETAGFTQSGILGGNFLRHFRVYFDFTSGAMRLEPLQKPKTAEINNPEVVSTP